MVSGSFTGLIPAQAVQVNFMGAFFHSICLPQDCATDLKALLTQWVEAKGFRLVANRPMIEIDDKTQRGAFIYWNKDWTILLYSEFGEFQRLGYELAKLKRPYLYLWQHDSDLWGYQIEDNRKTIAAFNSSPAYFGRVEDTGLPTNGDPELLCQTFELQGQEHVIRKLQRKKSMFMERVCEEFASTIGAKPAASCYEYVEESYLESESVQRVGFDMEHLFFVSDHSQREMEGFDIHSKAVREFKQSERHDRSTDVPPELRARMEHMQRQFRVMSFFFRMLTWPFRIFGWFVASIMRLWTWFVFKRSSNQQDVVALLASGGSPAFHLEGRQLINDRRRCRVTLSESVEPGPGWGRAVLAFKVHGVDVTCVAVRRDQIERYLTIRSPDRGKHTTVLEDENFMAGAMKAKAVVLKTEDEKPPKKGPAIRYVGVLIVQSPDLLYEFLYSTVEPVPEAVRKTIRDIVSSFEVF